ncbi:MAG: hypothetical protein M3O74_13930 [Pseudomonadota bacterium]|nr:hypothetical protein [Pseudomonadota bacterium]
MTQVQNSMDNATYRAEVLSTESKPDTINYGPATLLMALNLAVQTGNLLDQIKRAVFYGKQMDPELTSQALQAIPGIMKDLTFPISTGRYLDPRDADFFAGIDPEARKVLSLQGVDVRLLHAALGKFTESTEFVAAIIPTFFGQPVDKVNLLEESGDGRWYDEIALDALGYTAEQCNFTNIKKLKDKKAGRYQKGAFDPAAAVERDVNAERDLLEAGAAQ